MFDPYTLLEKVSDEPKECLHWRLHVQVHNEYKGFKTHLPIPSSLFHTC